MHKLSKLVNNENSLNGAYRVIFDIHIDPSKTATIDVLKNAINAVGEIDNMTIEKYSDYNYFEVGEIVELISSFHCEKPLYIDAHNNLVITDKLMTDEVTSAGTTQFSLPEGTIAEVNKKASKDTIELLFTGMSIDVNENKVAYLGILEVPCNLIRKQG